MLQQITGCLELGEKKEVDEQKDERRLLTISAKDPNRHSMTSVVNDSHIEVLPGAGLRTLCK